MVLLIFTIITLFLRQDYNKSSHLVPGPQLVAVQQSDTVHRAYKHRLSTGTKNKSEIKHIAFLKVHKAASSTVQNILYRFGSQRNLSFVLPVISHYISQHNAKTYHKVLPSPYTKTGKYDIVCNHVMFNHTKFKNFMYDDAIYIAIVREPLDLFISSAYYYKYVWPAEYLKKLNETTFIEYLIRDPEKYERLNQSRTFNYMAEDFGFVLNSVEDVLNMDNDVIASFISKLKNIFDFVMVVEYFDESLVMMKRLLNWTLKDILYIKQNEFKSKKVQPGRKPNITEEDRAIFRKRNRIDYAIYDTFLEIFLQKMSEEINLNSEVKHFKTILNDVQSFCTDKTPSANEITLAVSEWNQEFSVTVHDCELMLTTEIPFWKQLIWKHKSLLQHKKQ